MTISSKTDWRRVRLERGIYVQPNGAYGVCTMHRRQAALPRLRGEHDRLLEPELGVEWLVRVRLVGREDNAGVMLVCGERRFGERPEVTDVLGNDRSSFGSCSYRCRVPRQRRCFGASHRIREGHGVSEQ